MDQPRKTIVGAQVSSLKPYLQTEKELSASLQKLAEMGYRLVQMQWWNPEFSPEFVAGAVRDAGLQCVSTQDFYETVKADFARTVRLNELCGSRCVCVSGIPVGGVDRTGDLRQTGRSAPTGGLNRERVLRFAGELTEMAARLSPLGMTLAFHPRAQEWAALADTDGVTATELLLQNSPENVTLGLDLYHSNKAGLAADALLHRFAGRTEFVHFKDYVLDEAGAEHLTPVGQGQTDWRAAVAACRETGVPWAFAEQEKWEKDAFECMRESLAAMRAWGFEA